LEEALGRGRGVTSLSPGRPSSVVGPKMNNSSESDSREQTEPSEPIMSAIVVEGHHSGNCRAAALGGCSSSRIAHRYSVLESPRRSLSWKKRTICQLQISSPCTAIQADLDRFSRGFERDVYRYCKEPSGLGEKDLGDGESGIGDGAGTGEGQTVRRDSTAMLNGR